VTNVKKKRNHPPQVFLIIINGYISINSMGKLPKTMLSIIRTFISAVENIFFCSWRIHLRVSRKSRVRGDIMPDRDGKGPRKRSRFPSKKKGGRQLGDCK
jgi:hypothetical protein